MVAGHLSGVQAVVALSPYVGLRDVLPWLTQHARVHSWWRVVMLRLESIYGANPSVPTMNAESPNIAAIRAPVLLLQGTADRHVAWQTVQAFAQQLQAAGKTVRLVLFSGGHHGLVGTNQIPSTSDIESWFARYGLTFYP